MSMLPPCDLPSGPLLKDWGVSALFEAAGRADLWESVRTNPRYAKAVPEVLFQHVYDSVGDDFLDFFRVLDGAQPNAVHALLGRWAHEGVTILTTNFDHLIDAFAPPGSVVHLHGSLADPAEMVVRLHQIGHGIGEDLQERLDSAIRGRLLCVLGYSGNDRDIAAAVRYARPEGILWLIRNETDWAWRNLQYFAHPDIGIVVTTGEMGDLVTRLGATNPPQRPRRRNHQHRTAWTRQLSRGTLALANSNLLHAVQHYEAAASVALDALSATRDGRARPALRVAAVEALSAQGKFEEAIAAVSRHVGEGEPQGPAYELALISMSLGTLELESEHPDSNRAMAYFVNAAKMASELESQLHDDESRDTLMKFRAALANNLGVLFLITGMPFAAIKQFPRSIEDADRRGDLAALALYAANLSVAYHMARRFADARKMRRVALGIAGRYGFHHVAAYLLRWMGRLVCDHGLTSSGLRFLQAALGIYETVEEDQFGCEITRRMIEQYTSATGSS